MTARNPVPLAALQEQLRGFIARRVERPEDVDDILQDVLLRIHRGLSQLVHEDRLGPWLYRLARNAIADFGRSRARHPLTRLATPDSEFEHKPAAHWTAEQEMASYLSSFVLALPQPYRETLELTELEGLPQREVAARLGISLTATKARVRRGRAQLKEALEACCTVSLDVRGRVVDCQPRVDGVLPDHCCENTRK